MVVGTAKIKFRLFDVSSLKAKRGIIKSMVRRTANRFNVSVAETGYQDSHDWAEIGFSITGSDSRHVNAQVDKAIDFVDAMGLAMICDTQMEIIHL